MRYWLLRRPPLYGDINPSFANTMREYDMVFVNARLKPADIVYLIAAYNELYGWGHVEKKESYQDNELNGRAYRITVTCPVVQILTSREEVNSIPELAPLFETSVNLLELNAGQVGLLNGLLASKGVITPPDMLVNEVPKPTASIQDFPRVELSPDVRIWLCAAYGRLKAGKKIEPQEMVVELWEQIPDFNYQAIDRRLMQFGVELTLLGILHIDPTTELFSETDQVIRFVKEKIHKEPKVEHVTAEEVSEELEVEEGRVSLIFSLMNHLGHFWNGAGGNANFPGYTSITIKDEYVKREYLKYERLEPLLERFSKMDQPNIAKKPDEPLFVHSLLDWKFKERLENALDSIDRLTADDVLTYDTDELANLVARFAIPDLSVRTDRPVRDEKIPELEDLIADRKTGKTGHVFLIPIEGDSEWLQEISMQTVVSDSHPLAFLDNDRSWIYIKLTVSLDDPEGTLKQKLDERLALVERYAVYVSGRISEFNKGLALRMMDDLNKRRKAIQKGRIEAEATGFPTAYNPKHAERAIQIEKLVANLNARFTKPINHLSGHRGVANEMSDLHQDAVTIAKYMYENKFIGSRSIALNELRDKTNLSEEAFDTADEYLLEAKIYDGTMGGEAGQRWLTPSGVDFARKQEGARARALEVTGPGSNSSIDVFISHSSKDADIAKALLRLLRSALNIPADRIRCTSVDGHRLRLGASTDDQLRTEVRDSRVFLGLITRTSIESTYVLFELGARWGGGQQLAPVLVSSNDKGLLRGPLGGLNALACDSVAQVFQLVENIASDLGLTAASPSSYQDYVDSLVSVSRNATANSSAGAPERPKEFDFERMAKHVTNYFTAKQSKQVGFESLRKYVNETYSDQLLFEMIDRFPDQFRRVTLTGNRPAVGLVRREEARW